MNNEYYVKESNNIFDDKLKEKQKIKTITYLVMVVMNNFFANLSFILLACFTEFSNHWIITILLFICLSFISIRDENIKENNSEGISKGEKILSSGYIVVSVVTSIVYILMFLLVNQTSWVFIPVIFFINFNYLHNHLNI
ncbi:hypothetical protein BN85406190 [Alteracholeplasma palmae J233]|uniref:Uncharacterized protein n=1 Tax=Alteracholeplasma palmae (strain ATCC 49389 / J233) TaxID=1318466 RepID=U4KRI5_ALTPJ|nr:hypothetical protein [Alteracholeplasma palmae]CCV64196.1 hypothetical protein BN85406190 [Alteracholeplasma palmae J233]